jgi:hypothetical protein
MVWTGLVWLRIGTSGGFLWTQWWTFGFHKIQGISWADAQLATSQEELSSMRVWNEGCRKWPDLISGTTATYSVRDQKQLRRNSFGKIGDPSEMRTGHLREQNSEALVWVNALYDLNWNVGLPAFSDLIRL